MGTVEERFTLLTTAILREASAFFALSEQEQHIVNMFDVRSFNFQDLESLREQYNEEFLLFAGLLNKGSLLFPRKRCGEECVGIDCPCLLDQYVTFKERVRDNKDRFKDVWFTKNVAIKRYGTPLMFCPTSKKRNIVCMTKYQMWWKSLKYVL